METYHTRRIFSQEEFDFAIEMLDAYPWIGRDLHRRGFDEMMDRLVLDDKERDLFRALLKDFTYIDVDDCEELIQRILGQLEDWDCTKENTVIITTRKKSRDNDGSVVFMKQLEDRLYGWKEKSFINYFDYKRKFRSVRGYQKVVLIDDFIGSGMTMADRLQELETGLSKVKNKPEIFVLALAGMSEARLNYPVLANDNTYVPLWLNKAFDRDADCDKTVIMDGLLNRLNENNNDGKRYRLKTYGYGFKSTAGLYYNVHYRIPNNVLSIFWWGRFKENKDTFHSMFRRS